MLYQLSYTREVGRYGGKAYHPPPPTVSRTALPPFRLTARVVGVGFEPT